MGIKVGIDLGTTFSAVAWKNPRTGLVEVVRSDKNSSKLITPSAVQVLPDGSYICGEEAKEAFVNAEEGVATGFKRSMGLDDYSPIMPDGRQYNAESLSSILLHYLKQSAEQFLNQKIDEAVITVPAYFEDAPRQATKRAAQKAGLNVQDIISEPTAAALNYGLGHWRENAKILVYDLGGGTFDVTLVGMQKGNNLVTLGTTGEHKRGGRDWDERLAKLVVRKICEEIGFDESQIDINDIRSQAEKWKISLTEKASIKIKTAVSGYGSVQVVVSRDEFDAETQDLLELTGSLCDSLLRDLKIKWSEVTDCLLVGGSTRMPQVSKYLENRLGKKPITHVHPDHAVALGAAMRANMSSSQTGKEVELLAGHNITAELVSSLHAPVKESHSIELSTMSFTDAIAHALGIILADTEKMEYINRTVIPVYSPVPCKFAIGSQLAGAQNEMEIYVVQGSGSIAECVVNKKYIVSGIKKTKDEYNLIRVQYSYDSNHLIHVQARQGKETIDLPIREENFSNEDIARFMRPIDPKDFKKPQTIILVLDVSGSMYGQPMEDAKREMANFVKSYKGEASFGVMAVSDRTEWEILPTDNITKVLAAIKNMRCGSTGGGNSAHPFSAILDEYANNSSNSDVKALVMADGVWSYQDKAIEVAHECHQKGIEIIGMGFGCADEKFLKAISSNPENAQYTSSSSQLGISFGRIAQKLTSSSSFANFQKGSTEIDQVDAWETK